MTHAPARRRFDLVTEWLVRLWRRQPALREVLLVLCVILSVWGPFLASSRVDDKSLDWSFRADYVGYELNALLRDHEFPFWVTDGRFEQMRAKGVHDFFANPETDVFSILTPLAAVWGLLPAVKIALVLHLALGVWGCRRLLGTLAKGDGEPGILPLLLASLLVLCNGAIVAHILHGHIQFIAMASFPLSLSLVLDAFDDRLIARKRAWHAGLAGAMLATAYYGGATHPLFYFLLCFVALLPLGTVILQPRRWRVVLSGAALVGSWFVALALWKLLPGIGDFGDYHTNYFLAYDGWRDFASSFVVPWTPVLGMQLLHETNLYVGWLGVAILAFGALHLRRRSSWPLTFACVATAWVMFLKPDSPLLSLPLLRTQGAPTRLRFLLVMVAAILAVTEIQALVNAARRSPRRWLRLGTVVALACTCAGLAVDLSSTNVARHVQVGCEESPPTSRGPFDLAPEMVPNDRDTTVSVRTILANQFTYDFSTKSVARALIVAPSLQATTRMPHLSLEGDAEMDTVKGALAVRVNQRRGSFTLTFHDARVTWGLGVSLVSLLALGLLGLFVARARKETG